MLHRWYIDFKRTYLQLKSLFQGIIGAGLETTSTTINWCLLLLAKLPQTQTEIYSEIETMVGDEKITAEHRTDLVLLEAFILEVLRCGIVVPHFTKED